MNRSIGWESFGVSRGLNKSGVVVSSESSFRLAAVSQAIELISGEVATLPLEVWRQSENSRERALRHPMYRLLRWQPNPLYTAWIWRRTAMIHTLLFGNSISEIIRDGSNRPVQIWPLDPWRVQIFLNEALGRERDLIYVYSPPTGDTRRLFPEEVIHIRAMDSRTGLWGESPVLRCAEVIGLTTAAQDFASYFFGNGANLGGILKHPGAMGEEAFKAFKASWEEAQFGIRNSHKTPILEDGMDYMKIGTDPEQGQMLESREHQVNEVARIFNLPPHRIGGSTDSLTYSNEQQERLAFYTNSIRPWLTQWEQEIKMKGLGPEFVADFDMTEALRADQKTRYEGHKLAIEAGWLEKNEVRLMEGFNEIDGLDDIPEPSPLPLIAPVSDEDDDPDERDAFKLLRAVTRAAVERVLIRQRKAVDSMKNGKRLKFFDSQTSAWPTALEPILRSFEDMGVAVPADFGDDLGGRFARMHFADLENGATDLVVAWDADDLTEEIFAGLRTQ